MITVLRSLNTSKGEIATLVSGAQRLTKATTDRQEALGQTFQHLPGVLPRDAEEARGAGARGDVHGVVPAILHELLDHFLLLAGDPDSVLLDGRHALSLG